jgi:glycosyltransferase involved in cell wall biosynthesis
MNRPINIIYVGNYRPQTGGAPIFCAELMSALAREGCRARVLTSITDETRVETINFDAAQSPVEIQRFSVPFYFHDPFEPEPPRFREATRTGIGAGLERMIEESRPDVLLIREGWLPYTNNIARKHSVPTVALVRGNPTNAILRGVFPVDLAGTFMKELKRADRIVTVAHHFLPGLKQLGFNNARCITNTVNLEAFKPRPKDSALATELEIRESDIIALHAAQCKPIKRPLDIVYSSPAVLRRNPKVLYVILGEGVSRKEMKTMTEQLGVAKRFRFKRFVEYEQMPRYINLADMVIMPSESEGLSRMYLETQACAKTLIASDIPAAWEVVTPGKTGLLFKKGDIGDLTQKVLIAAGNPKLRISIGVSALQQIQNHNITKIVEAYLTVIRELL